MSALQPSVAQPLQNLKVLDLSRVLAGPWCSQLLADLGATVVKVERPGEGDETRGWGPPYAGQGEEKVSSYYLCANRGKKAIALDFATEAGRRLLLDLAAKCDVLIENFKVGGLKRYGLDYESVRKVNPSIVYCSITGFGLDGPYAPRPGYDFIVQGMGGVMSVNGAADGEPMKTGVAYVDVMTGLYASSGILAAVARRRETGEGAHVDVALLDVAVATLANQALNYLVTGRNPTRTGNAHPNIVPYQTVHAADAPFNIAVGNDGQFARLCEVVGRPDVARDPRFARNADRAKNKVELDRLLDEALRKRPARDWIEALTAAGVPSGPINSLEDVFGDPHVKARGLQLALPHATLGHAPGVACPLSISGVRVSAATAPPILGEHTDELLAEWLGLPEDRLQAMRAAGEIA